MAFGQIKQSVTGLVTDAITKPLAGANIKLERQDSSVLVVSDEAGRFSVSVEPGRYIVKVSFTGFQNYEEELLVIAGKTSLLQITLRESSQQLNDVEITSGTQPEVPGSYTISIEKTMRVPANFFDPVRMAASLPGVVATNDQGNSISIKGYSPNAMLWRLNGLDIVNPNHLANAGTLSDKPVANGGGVSVLSSQVLDKTKFYSGAMPIQYGNALSGAMDMSLRPGSKTSREHTVQASLIGIDLATEGPIGKPDGGSPLGGKAAAGGSYLVNYRYSTVGLLSQMGINFGDEKINFQDLTFNLDFNTKRGGNFSVFGFGGLSSNRFDRKPEKDWETEKDRYDIDFTGKVYGIGLSGSMNGSPKTFLQYGIAFSGQEQERKSQSFPLVTSDNYIFREYYNASRQIISGQLKITHKISTNLSVETGAQLSSQSNALDVETVTQLYISDFPNMKGSVNGVLLQPYFNSMLKLNRIEVLAGLRYVQFSFNGSSSWEPRLSANLPIFKGNFSLQYGITSQAQQTQTYLAVNNSNLGLTRAHQFLVNYQKNWLGGLRFFASAYYHKVFNAPSTSDPLPYSALNQINEFGPGNLLSIGQGRNQGLEFLLEKKFVNRLYFMMGGAVYSSGYGLRSSDNLNSRFNGKFTSQLSAGKEWSWFNKAFGIHFRGLYLGGLRQQEIHAANSKAYGETRYTNPDVYPVSLSPYVRVDARVSWRKNKPGYTRTISIDIQNLTAQQNLAYRYFDTFTQKIERKNQLGLIPVLVYRIDF